MTASADETILVQRYTSHDVAEKPRFYFYPESGKLHVAPEGLGDDAVRGWLVDRELVFSGARQVIFFRSGEKRCIALGSRIFEIHAGKSTVVHKRRIVVSELKVIDEVGNEFKVRYMTPWWRLVFDDGMFPELQFPLKEFAKQISADGADAMGRHGYLQNDGG